MRLDTNQRKLAIWLPGILCIIILSWFLAIKKTITGYSELKYAETELNSIYNPEQTIRELKMQLNDINSRLNVSDSIQTDLIFKQIVDISKQTQNISIVQFPEVHYYELDDHLIETFRVELEGNYKSLLLFIYNLEKNKIAGKIISACFKVEKDFKQNKEFLRLTVYIRNFHKS